MNAKMVEAVRGRLEGMGDEELLRLWRENDRERYAEEAFEAARLILVARGVEVPAQEPSVGRVPVARKAWGTDPATDEFWMGWLRPVLWVGITIAGVRCLSSLVSVGAVLRAGHRISWPTIYSFVDLVEAIQLGLHYVLPLLLLYGAIESLRRRLAGRVALLIWRWTVVVACALFVVRQGVYAVYENEEPMMAAIWMLNAVDSGLASAGFALMVVFLVTRPQIKQLFEAPVVGFDLAALGAKAGAEADQQGEGDGAEREEIG